MGGIQLAGANIVSGTLLQVPQGITENRLLLWRWATRTPQVPTSPCTDERFRVGEGGACETQQEVDYANPNPCLAQPAETTLRNCDLAFLRHPWRLSALVWTGFACKRQSCLNLRVGIARQIAGYRKELYPPSRGGQWIDKTSSNVKSCEKAKSIS